MHLIPVFMVWVFCVLYFFFSSSPTTVMVQKFNEPSAEVQFCSVNQQGKIAASSSEELFLNCVQSKTFAF